MIAGQKRFFPALRSQYGPAVQQKVAKHNVAVSTSDADHATIDFVGGMFGSVGYQRGFTEMMWPILRQLRFKKIQYREYRTQDTFASWNIQSPEDDVLVVWERDASRVPNSGMRNPAVCVPELPDRSRDMLHGRRKHLLSASIAARTFQTVKTAESLRPLEQRGLVSSCKRFFPQFSLLSLCSISSTSSSPQSARIAAGRTGRLPVASKRDLQASSGGGSRCPVLMLA